jgi:hypothetical protein
MPFAVLMVSKRVIGKEVGQEKPQCRKVVDIAPEPTKGWGIPN